MALAGALRKLDAAAPRAQVNPLAAYGAGIAKLFSTQPPTAERVTALNALAPKSAYRFA